MSATRLDTITRALGGDLPARAGGDYGEALIETRAMARDLVAMLAERDELITVACTYLAPCPPPDVVNGHDSCAHGSWPCERTNLGWRLRGLDPTAEQKRIMGAVRARMAVELEPEPEITHHAIMRNGVGDAACVTPRFWEYMTRAPCDVTCPDCLELIAKGVGGA